MLKLLYVLLAAASLPAAERHLVLISIDGLKSTTLHQPGALTIPNLTEMRDKGAVAEGMKGVFPTVTYPSHTAMVTGCPPADSGILTNTLFDPENQHHGMWYYFTEAIRKPTLWQAVQAAGGKVGAVWWPVTVGASIDYNVPEFFPILSDNEVMLQRATGTPGLLAEIEKEIGKITPAIQTDDMGRARIAAAILRNKKPRLLLVHLIDLDHQQHLFGPGSSEAGKALEEIDQALGVLRQAVKTAGLESSTDWIVDSDHGFFPVSQAFQAPAFLNSLGVATFSEKGKGPWRIAAHNSGGSVEFVAADPNDSAAQELVVRTLKALAANPIWGIERVLERDELTKLRAYPDAFAAISFAAGFMGGSAVSGPWLTPSGATKGTHGYLPGPPELDASFLAYGPGIQSRALPRGQLIDVAKTAAALLGIDMPEAQGRNLLESH